MREGRKLLGRFGFVSRTFEGEFKDNPFVLDMDANLYIGPADHTPRDEHAAVEVIYHFLNETGRPIGPLRDVLRDRKALLEAFRLFDAAHADVGGTEFQILLFGTYDGEPLVGMEDDDLPAGPCGRTINEVKRRFYEICERCDPEFTERDLSPDERQYERRFWRPRRRQPQA